MMADNKTTTVKRVFDLIDVGILMLNISDSAIKAINLNCTKEVMLTELLTYEEEFFSSVLEKEE